jgi:hypothetical protein
VEQGGEEGPVAGGELRLVLTELAFEHHELVAQSEDFGVLLPLAHRQQSQHRERVGHGHLHQAQQRRTIISDDRCAPRGQCGGSRPLTLADEVFGSAGSYG